MEITWTLKNHLFENLTQKLITKIKWFVHDKSIVQVQIKQKKLQVFEDQFKILVANQAGLVLNFWIIISLLF